MYGLIAVSMQAAPAAGMTPASAPAFWLLLLLPTFCNLLLCGPYGNTAGKGHTAAYCHALDA